MKNDDRQLPDTPALTDSQSTQTEWDAAFPCSFEMEMRDDRGLYASEKQKPLGHFPIRADMFVEKLSDTRDFSSINARRFRKWNFVEFKAPEDELNIDTFIKGRLYAGHFKISAETVDGYRMQDITYTFVRQRKPVKLMKRLAEKWRYSITSEYPGIYYVESNDREDYFFQIMVVGELDVKQCGWLGMMKKGITQEEFLSFMTRFETLENAEDRRNADVINDIVVKANAALIQKWKERSNMYKALREIMRDEIDEEVSNARTDTELSAIKNLMETMRWSAEQAMQALKIPESEQQAYSARL